MQCVWKCGRRVTQLGRMQWCEWNSTEQLFVNLSKDNLCTFTETGNFTQWRASNGVFACHWHREWNRKSFFKWFTKITLLWLLVSSTQPIRTCGYLLIQNVVPATQHRCLQWAESWSKDVQKSWLLSNSQVFTYTNLQSLAWPVTPLSTLLFDELFWRVTSTEVFSKAFVFCTNKTSRLLWEKHNIKAIVLFIFSSSSLFMRCVYLLKNLAHCLRTLCLAPAELTPLKQKEHWKQKKKALCIGFLFSALGTEISDQIQKKHRKNSKLFIVQLKQNGSGCELRDMQFFPRNNPNMHRFRDLTDLREFDVIWCLV